MESVIKEVPGEIPNHDANTGFTNYTFAHVMNDPAMPLMVTANRGQVLHQIDDALREKATAKLQQTGAILFRGFTVATPIDFKKFAASFGQPLANYEFGSTPRSKVFAGVYSSTEYPAHQSIPMHNEQSYTRQWPTHIWFHCMKPSLTGGETPIADSRLVYQRIDSALREEFARKEILYVRNYSASLDVPWQKVFNTEDRSIVEQYCQSQGIEWEWKSDGELRTRQRCQAVLQHPRSGEWLWFNQAHLFHISSIEQEARESMLQVLGEENLPRNTYFGDGSPIETKKLDAIREVYRQTSIAFQWQAGDVLMLDNLLFAHGRNPYTGDRKVIVAMA